MSIAKQLCIFCIILCSTVVPSFAVEIKEAMVVSFTGAVEVFSLAKTGNSETKNSIVLFEGQKYTSRRVQAGVKVSPGDILRTGNDGKMKIIYNTGDVFILGPTTAFTVPSKLEKGQLSSEVLYGKARALINKNGPMSGLQIKTKTIVSGVRGTDLYVSYNPLNKKTQVHVLRGEVEIRKVAAANSIASTGQLTTEQPISIKTGQKVILDNPDETASVDSGNIQVSSSNQQELKVIQAQTSTPTLDLKNLKPGEQNEIQALLKTAQEKVVEDIKVATPEIYKSLQSQKLDTLEEISQVVVHDLSKSAPKGSSKPKMSDFGNEEDIYQRYFKPVGQ